MVKKFKFMFIYFLSLVIFSSCNFLGIKGNDIDPDSIALDTPMYNIQGEEVSEISLEKGESEILRYPEPTYDSTVVVGKSIREKKSVRLGGYFYDFDYVDRNKVSAVDLKWFANNFDLLSIGGLWIPPTQSSRITGEQVAEMRKINKTLQFYPMVFSAALYNPFFDEEKMKYWVMLNNNGKEYTGGRAAKGPFHMMDLGNEEYAKFFAEQMTELVDRYNADGIILDELPYNIDKFTVDINEVQTYESKDELYAASMKFLSILDENTTFNLMNQAFFPEALKYLDGVWGEKNFKYDDDSWYFANMGLTYDKLINYEFGDGKKDMPHIFAAWYNRDSKKELKFAVAYYLLMKNSNNVVFQMQPQYDGGYGVNTAGYHLTTHKKEYENNKDLLDIEIGNPKGKAKYLGSDVWSREYDNGKVFVRMKK